MTPVEKKGIVTEARARQAEIIKQFNDGLLSREERKRLIIEVWHKAKSDVEKVIPNTIDPQGSVHDLVISGARGSMGQLTQMAGMKGLIQNTQGETIEFPIVASYKEGLTPIEYFTTTHGSRKGLADTALNTARAGYLTRKLFDVAQDAIIVVDDCDTKDGIVIGRQSALGLEVDMAKNIKGRYLAKDAVAADGSVLFGKGTFLTLIDAKRIEDAGAESVVVRSPMTCKSHYGICQKCYGADVTTWAPIDLGEAVGTIAAQAIGEPGTQLTMNTKHVGGAASAGGDVVSGLPRVEEVFERRSPKNPAVLAPVSGVVTAMEPTGRDMKITITPEVGEKKGNKNVELMVSYPRTYNAAMGQTVAKGDFLSDGSADLTELFKYAGREKTQEYIIQSVSKIYELQGVFIARKHVEVIIKQMFSRKKIKDAGETTLSVGELVEDWEFFEANKDAEDRGVAPAVADTNLLGIAEVSLTRRSFLSAASFQYTTKVLINAAVKGAKDPLRGLKENVIIGRLIPAGSGFHGSKKQKMIEELQTNERNAADALRVQMEEKVYSVEDAIPEGSTPVAE